MPSHQRSGDRQHHPRWRWGAAGLGPAKAISEAGAYAEAVCVRAADPGRAPDPHSSEWARLMTWEESSPCARLREPHRSPVVCGCSAPGLNHACPSSALLWESPRSCEQACLPLHATLYRLYKGSIVRNLIWDRTRQPAWPLSPISGWFFRTNTSHKEVNVCSWEKVSAWAKVRHSICRCLHWVLAAWNQREARLLCYHWGTQIPWFPITGGRAGRRGEAERIWVLLLFIYCVHLLSFS